MEVSESRHSITGTRMFLLKLNLIELSSRRCCGGCRYVAYCSQDKLREDVELTLPANRLDRDIIEQIMQYAECKDIN